MTRTAALAQALGARRCGSGWIGRCPSHGDRTPSLSISEAEGGRPLLHCFAGCSQGDVLAALKARGLWPGGTTEAPRCRPARHRAPDPDDDRRSAAARRLWRSATPVAGTLAETYLAARGFTGEVPSSLRFLPVAKHPSGGRWPALVAAVVRWPSRRVASLQRTFIAHNGSAKAPVSPARLSLGPCRGGAVRLAALRPDAPLVLTEGIEDGLAVLTATGWPPWATLGVSALRSVAVPPPDVAPEVVIAADADAPGIAAARALSQRLLREGHKVRIALPPPGAKDFAALAAGEVGHGLAA